MSDGSARSGDARRASTRTGASAHRRKTYAPPRIVEYGSAAKLTTSKPGTKADGTNSIKMTCL